MPGETIVVDAPAKIIPRVEVVSKRTVKLGDTVIVVPLDSGRLRKYPINSSYKQKFPDIFNEIIGKNIGSTVTIRDGKFIITDIT